MLFCLHHSAREEDRVTSSNVMVCSLEATARSDFIVPPFVVGDVIMVLMGAVLSTSCYVLDFLCV